MAGIGAIFASIFGAPTTTTVPPVHSQPAAAALALAGNDPFASPTPNTESTPQSATTTIINNYITQPVIERTIQTIQTSPALTTGYVTQSELAAQLATARNSIDTTLYGRSYPVPASTPSDGGIWGAIGMMGRIGSLSGTSLSSITVSGVSGLTDADIPDSITASNYLSLSGSSVTGTSSFLGVLSVGSTDGSVAPFYVAGRATTSVVGSTGTALTGLPSDSTMVARGNYIYSLKEGSLMEFLITDISAPAAPVILSTTQIAFSAACGGKLDVQGSYAYLDMYCSPGFGGGSLTVFDISNPKSPRLMSSIAGTASYSSAFAVQGKYAYLGSASLIIDDISNPNSINAVSFFSLSTLGMSITQAVGIAISGRYAYMIGTGGSPNFYTIDVGNISNPAKTGSLLLSDTFVDGNYPTPIVSGRYVYVTGDTRVSIIDISDPANPALAGSIIPPAGVPKTVQVSGRNAYVAQSNGVAVYDISNVASPSYLGLLTTTTTYALAISGRYALTSAGEALNLGGAYIQQLETGGLFADTLNVKQTARFQNNIEAFGGLNIGSPGLISSGPVGIYSEGSASNVLSLTASSTGKTAAFNLASFTNLATSSTASIIKSGLQISSTGTWTGTGASNIGLYISSVTGSANNYDAIFNGGGNVGIGTTTPQWLLNPFSASASQLALSAGAGIGQWAFRNAGGNLYFATTTVAGTATSSPSALTIVGSSGNLGIGTTTPWRTLSVTGTVGFDGLTGSTGGGSLCLDSNKQVVYNSGSDACLSSTRATKHDITDLDIDALTLVSSLQPVSFVYNNDASSTVRYGFIAEETAAVNPHLATYDANGAISGIDDRSIISIVVEAIRNFADAFTTKELTFKRATGDELCLKKSDGTSVCVTGDQLAAVLGAVGQQASAPIPPPSTESTIETPTESNTTTEEAPPSSETELATTTEIILTSDEESTPQETGTE